MGGRVGRTAARLLIASTFVVVASGRADDDAGWRPVHAEGGVRVSTRAEPGRRIPSFRGQAELRGSILHLLAIVLDDARAKEWAKVAEHSQVLRVIDPRTELVYSRAPQVWPVHDRDLVMKRRVEVIRPGQEFKVRLTCVSDEKPRVAGVIRMTDCETVFWLRKIDEATTFVDFRVRADPGGKSPDWLVRWASESVPLETLVGLRKQLRKTARSYDAAMRAWEHAQ
jgi:hypothetical protein